MRWKWCITLLIMLLQSAPAFAEVVVIIRREAHSAGKYIRVGDVARVDGPQEQVREVAGTILGPAPSRGESKSISRWDIESRLLEMGILAAVSFSGNDHVRVHGSGTSSARAPESYQAEDMEYQPLGPVPATSLNGRRNRDADLVGEPPRGLLRPGSDKSDPTARPQPFEFELSRPRTAQPEGTSRDASRRIADAVSDYISDRYRSGKNREDISVESRIMSVDGHVPADAAELVVEEALDGRVPGKAELRLRLRDRNGAAPRFVTVVADTTVYAPALVAVRNISRGDSLEARDVGVTRVKMESGTAYLPPNPDVVVGREAKRAIRAGEPILARDAQPGEAVKRGSMVIVKTVGKGWEIQSKAKALGAGGMGDIISVEDTTTRNKFPTRIIGRGMVEVVVNRDHTKME